MAKTLDNVLDEATGTKVVSTYLRTGIGTDFQAVSPPTFEFLISFTSRVFPYTTLYPINKSNLSISM